MSAAGRITLVDGRTGQALWRVDGVLNDRLGRSVAAAGDFDGDGRGDVLVGAPGIGAARVYSGASGTLLLQVTGLAGAFGRSVAGLGDVDGDAVPDLAVGEVDLAGRGRVSLVSGVDGHELRSLAGAAGESLGGVLARVPDVTRDGRAELAVLSGALRVIDPVTGNELFRLDQDPRDSARDVAVLANVGGHPRVDKPGLVIVGGRDDVLAASGLERGVIRIVTADTGDLVREYTGHFGELYTGVAAAGDVDGDRFSDFVLAGMGPDPERAGWLAVVSGRTGAVLRQVNLAGTFVDDVGVLPDADGDGRAELVATTNALEGSELRNRVSVVAGNAPVQAFGTGIFGSGGIVPQISIGGCPRLRGTLRVETERVVGGALGALVLGTARVDAPFRGGTLHPRRDFTFLHRASGLRGAAGAGDAFLTLTLPTDPTLAGLTFYVQAGYFDRGAPLGVSLTRALQLSLY